MVVIEYVFHLDPYVHCTLLRPIAVSTPPIGQEFHESV